MKAERKKSSSIASNEKDCGMRHCARRMRPSRISTASIRQSLSQLHAVWSKHWRSIGRRSKRK